MLSHSMGTCQRRASQLGSPGREREMDFFQCAASIMPETRHETTAHRKETIDQFMGMARGLICKTHTGGSPIFVIIAWKRGSEWTKSKFGSCGTCTRKGVCS